MSIGFTKIFPSLIGSSVWGENLETRVVWVTLLALCNGDGIAEVSVPGLARLANVSLEQVQSAILTLTSPDPFSKSKKDEGRRVREVDGGFEVVNYLEYRQKSSPEETARRNAERQRRWRERNAVTLRNVSVTPCNENNPTAEAEAEEKQNINMVFEFWKKTMNHPNAKLDKNRTSRIKARLREGYTVDQLCCAISNASQDKFLMGENEKGCVYDGIKTLLRDAEQVERLMALDGSESAGGSENYVWNEETGQLS